MVPPALFCPESDLRAGIIKAALGFFPPLQTSSPVQTRRKLARGGLRAELPRHEAYSHCFVADAKPPRKLFLGLVLVLVSLLVLLALATWHASDPSLNTATDRAVKPHNWVGLFGSYISDLMLQSLGLTAFLLPLWLGGIGWTWMRSRPSGSALLRWSGTVLALAFVPAVFGLMPWHWRWLHVLPVEGVVGRLMAGLLVAYLNIQGAWLVAGVLAATGLYFASAISFWAVKESLENYWLHLRSWLDRWKNWREERAEHEGRTEAAARRRDCRRVCCGAGVAVYPRRL